MPARNTARARAVMHFGIANTRWRGKRSWHSRRMHNPQFTYLVRGPLPRTNYPTVITKVRTILNCIRQSLYYPLQHDVCIFISYSVAILPFDFLINTDNRHVSYIMTPVWGILHHEWRHNGGPHSRSLPLTPRYAPALLCLYDYLDNIKG